MSRNIINFRISPEVERKLEQLKKEGCITNVSAFMNALILDYGRPSDTERYIRTIPDDVLSVYKDSPFGLEQIIKIDSRPFCDLSIKRHAEIKRIIEENGMHYFYFPISDKDLYMAIIACNKEEASIKFQRYYVWNSQDNQYVRTSLPLPQYRYDIIRKNIIIIENEASHGYTDK